MPRLTPEALELIADKAFESAEMSRVTTALAHPVRLRFLEMLEFGGAPAESLVGSIVDEFGINRASAGQHLRTLLRARLVQVTEDRNSRWYSLVPRAAAPLAAWLAALRID